MGRYNWMRKQIWTRVGEGKFWDFLELYVPPYGTETATRHLTRAEGTLLFQCVGSEGVGLTGLFWVSVYDGGN